MSLPDYDSRCRAESERGGHGRLDRELRWRGNLKDGQRRCCVPEDFWTGGQNRSLAEKDCSRQPEG